MTLIIYWLTLLIVLPLLYCFWRKNSWRLILGIVILIVLIVGWVLPGKLAFSMLKKELKKVDKQKRQENLVHMPPGTGKVYKAWEGRIGKPWQKLEEALKNNPHQELTAGNQKRIALEKEILRLRKELDKPDSRNQDWKIWKAKEWEWIRKWGGIKEIPNFLFGGEEFNYQLTKERTTFKGSWQIVQDRDYHSDVIDFGKNGNAKSDFVKKRIREIWDYWNSGITRGNLVDNYPIILLKNIDKITNSELKIELLKIVDSKKNVEYGKYQIKDWDGKPVGEEGNIDLSKFLLIVTTSNSNPKLSPDLRAKLKHVEPFFDKYFWTIFFVSEGLEIIIFFSIRRSRKRKTKVGKINVF